MRRAFGIGVALAALALAPGLASGSSPGAPARSAAPSASGRTSGCAAREHAGCDKPACAGRICHRLQAGGATCDKSDRAARICHVRQGGQGAAAALAALAAPAANAAPGANAALAANAAPAANAALAANAARAAYVRVNQLGYPLASTKRAYLLSSAAAGGRDVHRQAGRRRLDRVHREGRWPLAGALERSLPLGLCARLRCRDGPRRVCDRGRRERRHRGL